MLVGIDDTDSEKGMCTTYLAALLCEELGVSGYPKLIRLNPNIPYKTRGNGAIAFEVAGDAEKIKETVLSAVERYAQFREKKTNPGVAFMDKPKKKGLDVLDELYRGAVSRLVTIEEADEAARNAGAQVYKFKNGRGIIGALSAIGAKLPDPTYEIIAYRSHKKKEKKIDRESVFRMDDATYPDTFNNVDRKTGRILILPHGYDPVFCGIRGNSVEAVKKAWSMIKPLEDIERTQIFVSNQGTDAHLRKKRIGDVAPYDCAIIEGSVSREPRTIKGGHVFFRLKDETGGIDCGAYKPTGEFRDVVRKLRTGDVLQVCGGISKHPGTLNIEKIRILSLARAYEKNAPVCCGRNMTSAGKEKGYKCRKCGKRIRSCEQKEVRRDLLPGFYEVPPRAKRHLSMPLVRMGPKAKSSNGRSWDTRSLS